MPEDQKMSADNDPSQQSKASPEPKEPKQKKPQKLKKKPRQWSTVLVGSAIAVLALGLAAAGSYYPGYNAAAQLPPRAQVLPLGDSVANCVGPTKMLSGSAAGTDPEFSANSSSTTSQLSAAVLSNTSGDLPGSSVQSLDAQSTPLFALTPMPPEATTPATPSANPSLAPVTGVSKEKAVVERGKDVSGETVLRTASLAGRNSLATGAVVVNAHDGDLAGLAAATCQAPSNELWLSGASTTVGRTAVLVLGNSTVGAAKVSLEMFGTSGPIVVPGEGALVVAPGTTRSVVLSGLAPDQELLSVHIKSSGGAVSAVIQQSVLRGLTSGGVDFLAPGQAPSATQTIPGVRVGDPSAAAAISNQAGYKDAATALQLTVPGNHDAVVEVKAFGIAGQVALPNGGVLTAAAGKTQELSLAGLAKGTYTLSVTADSDVVAGVRLVNSTAVDAAVDIAYAPSTARLGDNHLAVLPVGVESSFAFTAPGGAASVSLTPISETGVLGSAKSVELKPGMTSTVEPAEFFGTGTAAVLVSASGAPVFGTLLLSIKDSANIAILPLAGSLADSRTQIITTTY